MAHRHINAGNLYGGIEPSSWRWPASADLCPEMEPHFGLCFAGRLSETLESCGAAVHSLGNVRISRPWTVWNARRLLHDLLDEGTVRRCRLSRQLVAFRFRPDDPRPETPARFLGARCADGPPLARKMGGFTPADLVLANSHWTAAAVPNLFPGVRCEVVYGPVPAPAAVDRGARPPAHLRGSGAPAEATVILQVSRLDAGKAKPCSCKRWSVWRRRPTGIAGSRRRPAVS